MSRLDIYNKIIILAMIVAMTSGCRDTTPPLTISFEKKTSLPGNGRASAVSFAVNGLGYVLLPMFSLLIAGNITPHKTNGRKNLRFPERHG